MSDDFGYFTTCMTGGLDLAAGGRDFSALVIAEHFEVYNGKTGWSIIAGEFDKTDSHHLVQHIQRWPRGTDPGDVLREASQLLAHPRLEECCRLRYDATGLGAGVRSIVRDMYQDGRFRWMPIGITITGGEKSEKGVPKVDLVSSLSRLLQEERLHLAEAPHRADLVRELEAFQAKLTPAGNWRYEAESESVHDDLVTATMLATFRPLNHVPARRVDGSYFRQMILSGQE